MALGISPEEIVEKGEWPLLTKANHWLRIPLREVATVQNGFAFKSEYFDRDNGVPLIRIRDIAGTETEHRYSGPYEDAYLVASGDILVGMDGDFRATRWKGESALLNQRVCRLTLTTSCIDEKFFFLCLQPFLEAINAETSSITVKHLSSRTIEEIPLPLPPLGEQRRIVAKIEELFSELDKGVESLKTARGQLEIYRQAVLKNAFEGKLTDKWRRTHEAKLEPLDKILARIPPPTQPRGGREASTEVIEGVAALAVNKSSKAPPQGWKWVPLLRIARQETGHTPSRKHSSYWGGRKFWISIPDARRHHGRVIHDTLQKATAEGLENSAARTLPEGTVCLSRTASVGYVCILGKPMATSQDFATWTCTEALNPRFLMYAFMAEGAELRRFGKGTTHTTIYFPEIRALHICLPPIAEQDVIVAHIEEKLEQIAVAADEIDTQLARAEILRQSILRAAFAGELRTQDPDDEPASVLLDRITKTNAKPPKARKLKVAA